MKYILMCRRTVVSLTGIGCLTALGIVNGTDVSMAIAGIAAALSSANAWQARGDATPKPAENPQYK